MTTWQTMYPFCTRLVILVLTSLLVSTFAEETEPQRLRRQVALTQQFRPVEPGFYHATAFYCYLTYYANICPYNTCFYSTTRSSCCLAHGQQGWYCLCSSPTCSAATPPTTSTTSTKTTTTANTTTSAATTTTTTTAPTTATTTTAPTSTTTKKAADSG